MTAIENHAADLDELKMFHRMATRDYTRKIFEREITKLRETIDQLAEVIEKSKVKENIDDLSFTTIGGYGWDQKDQLVKVYVTKDLDGIGKHDEELIRADFSKNSADLKIIDFNGRNLRLGLAPLAHPIVPDESKIQIKSNSITMTLKKADASHWESLLQTGKSGKKLTKPDTSALGDDPQASLMGMMRDLYNSGDDEIKKSIAQGWAKAKPEDINNVSSDHRL